MGEPIGAGNGDEIGAIDCDAAGGGPHGFQEQLEQGGFAGAGITGDEGDGAAFGGEAGVGKVSWTTHDDLAAADAALLASRDVIDGATPPLTGSEAFDLADLAQTAGRILGRRIARTLISDEDMTGNAKAAGVPEERIAVMMGYYRAARAGEFARVDTTLANILGREPATMLEFMTTRLR